MPGRLEFSVGIGGPGSAKHRDAGSPMRLLLVGDFGGRGSRGVSDASSLAERRALRVDLDTIDAVFTRLAPAVSLEAGSGVATGSLDFRTIDDFHPDQLYGRVEVFARLRALRARLMEASTFDAAAAELRAQGVVAAGPIAPAPAPAAGEAESDSGTLERLLGGGAPTVAAPARRPGSTIDALIRGVVAPHIVQGPAPHQSVYVAAVDTAISGAMQRLLHDPAFAALECAWRGVHWLVSRLELNEELQLFLLDVTREELRADLAAANGDPSKSGLYRSLCHRAVDEGPRWSLLAGLWAVGPSAADLGEVAALGAIASHAGGPIVLAAAPSLYGCDSVSGLADPLRWQPLAGDAGERWSALRHSAVAPWIGLVAPRFLLRLPYGKSTDATERFAFEEQPAIPVHGTLLWGPGSLAVALQLGLAFGEGGWEGTSNPPPDVDDLPAYTVRTDGGAELQPCGEAWLGERAGEALIAKGLMPLLSHRQRAAVRLARLQSIAEPPAPLAGLSG